MRAARSLATLASLLWVAQAACLALALASLAAVLGIGDGVGSVPDAGEVLWRVSGGDLAGADDGGAWFRALPWWPIIGFALVGLCRAALETRSGGLAFTVADAVMAEERDRQLVIESRRSPREVSGRSSAEFAALVAEKVALLQPWLMRYRIAEARVRLVPLLFILAVLPFSWVAALILLITGPLIPLFMALIGQAAGKASEAHLQEIGSMNALLLERIAARVDIRVLAAEERSLARFREAANGLRQRTMRVLGIAFLSSTVLELFAAIGVALVAVHVGFSLLGLVTVGTWGSPLTLFEGLFILLLAPEFYQPLRELGAAWHDRAAALAVQQELADSEALAANRIVGGLTAGDADGADAEGADAEGADAEGADTAGADAPATEAEVAEAGAPLVPAIGDGPPRLQTESLVLESAVGEHLAWPDIDLAPGGSLALCGPSGSGKSTLLYLLSGLQQADSGRVMIDGMPLDDANAAAWRQRIGWMSQSPAFAEGSLRHNLLLAAPPGTNDDAILAALDAAGAVEVVERLPGGLDAIPGESGAGVSGGEARRLSLARLLLADPAVVLADEPTADLDEATAEQVRQTLCGLVARGVSVIVATHDEALAESMDSRLVLTEAAPEPAPELPAAPESHTDPATTPDGDS